MDVWSSGAPVVKGNASPCGPVLLELSAAVGQFGQLGEACAGFRDRVRVSDILSRGEGVRACSSSGRGAGVTGAAAGGGTCLSGLGGLAVASAGPVEDAP